MDAVLELTRSLVTIPSHEDETAAGDHLETWLERETSATVTRDEAGNVIASRGSGDTQLALVGHHDVVPPADTQVGEEGYVVERRGDRLYGRGTADMKGAVAAMACAFRDADPAEELVFASFVGEEVGGVGARAAIDDGFCPEYAVVGEGSTGYSTADVTDVVVAHRGRRGSTITATGAAAHASEPDAGDNAIYAMTPVIDAVQSLDGPTATVLGHGVDGTIVVTEVSGGTAWNVVPDTCSITVDERTVPDARADLDSLVDDPRLDWEIDQDLPPMACDDPEFADAVLDVATRTQETDPRHVTKPHATDAGWLADAGTTCLVCGPAEPGQAHTDDESVAIPILDRCYRIYRRVADTWAPRT